MTCDPRIIVQRPQRPLTVVRESRGTVITRDPAQTVVTRDNARSTVVTRSTQNELVVQKPVVRIVERVEAGPQGPRGFPGGSIPPIEFAYGDAAAIRYTTEGPGTFTLARVDVTTVFNGAAPSILVGFVGDTDALMTATDSDLLFPAGFENTPDLHVAGATGVWVEIAPSGSSQGAGVLYLVFMPD